MTTEYLTVGIVLIITGVILFFALLGYYLDLFWTLRDDTLYRIGIRTKRDFKLALIPFQLTIKKAINNFKDLD